jgi:hypothetical protein
MTEVGRGECGSHKKREGEKIRRAEVKNRRQASKHEAFEIRLIFLSS